MIQQAVVDLVVLVAALWLVWTFAPFAARRRVAALLRGHARATAASPMAAGGVEGLQAAELDGRPPPGEGAGGGPGCGSGCDCA